MKCPIHGDNCPGDDGGFFIDGNHPDDMFSIGPECNCKILDREPDEEEREWFKRWMCMYHWMQTDYYKRKLNESEGLD